MKYIKTESMEIKFIEHDILELRYFDNLDISIDMSIENYQAYDLFVGSKQNLKRLIVLGENMNMSQEAKHLSKEEDKKRENNIKAQGVLISNYFHHVAASVYFRLFTPSYQNKNFKSREKAIEWLKSV